MIKTKLKSIAIIPMLLAMSVILPAMAQAQAVSSSTGRSAGQVIDMGNNNYKAMKKIRNYINKGDFKRAASRSRRIIKTEDRNRRSGLSKSEFYKEVYNCLCVSLAGQGETTQAMEACNTSLEYNPKHWESLKTRATLYFMSEDFPKSLKDFNMALSNAPENEALSTVLKSNIEVVKSRIN